MKTHLRELHIWECPNGPLRMSGFPDPLPEEPSNDESVVACLEPFLVPVDLIKKKDRSQRRGALWKRRVYPPEPVPVAKVMQIVTTFWEEGEVFIPCRNRAKYE